jgi:stearoyl-CoA desaturase (delta-9 desaturase)
MLPLIIFFSMASISLWLLYGITNTIEHMFGYRTYDIKDESKNQPILRLLFLGAGLHNNHHYKSNSHTFNLRNKWYEFDFDGWLIELLFMKKPT